MTKWVNLCEEAGWRRTANSFSKPRSSPTSITATIKGMAQLLAHCLGAGWHCCWRKELGVIFSSGLFSTSPLLIRKKEISLLHTHTHTKRLWKIRNTKNQELNTFFKTGGQGNLYHGSMAFFFFLFIFPAEISHYFRHKQLAVSTQLGLTHGTEETCREMMWKIEISQCPGSCNPHLASS